MKNIFGTLSFFLLISIYLPANLNGQSSTENAIELNCVTHEFHSQQHQNNPEYRESILENESYILRNSERQSFLSRNNNTTYTIPVVVHLFHRGNLEVSQNLMPDSKIEDAIQNLNNDFKGLAIPTFGITGDTPQALDMDIEFCLATEDPAGNPTTGITRTDASAIPDFVELGISYENITPGADANLVRDLSRWPTSDYLNIWLTYEVNDGNIGGYAQFPNGGEYDGVTISYFFVEGTVLTHEVGHWLNLLHVFAGDANGSQCPENSDCTTQGDKVCDTPPFRRVECMTATCSNAPEVYNSSYNFMGYCSLLNTRFTQGQKDRMIATLNGPIRSPLLSSSGCSGSINPSTVDNDNDGVIYDEDCDDNDPNIPTVAGTPCNDENSNTSDDVILADGCTCLGTTVTNCNISVSSANGAIIITGMSNNSNTKVFDSNIISIWQCNPWTGSPCSNSETITGLNIGETYFVSVESDQCQEWIQILVEGGVNSSISINCPSDLTLSANSDNLLILDWVIPSAISNCPTGGLSSTQISGPTPGTQVIANNRTYTVVYEFTDDCGNSNTCSFKVIEQAFNPSIDFISCPDDISIEATSDNGAIVGWAAPIASTNCSGGVSINQSAGHPNGALFPIGNTEIVFQGLADSCNASTSCVFNVTVTEPNNSVCDVSVSSVNGLIIINGMTSNSNTKVFNSNIVSVWKCNPWTGAPCSDYETISGLNVGETYYISVESDLCQEWIPIVVEGAGNNGIIVNCPSDITLTANDNNLVTMNWEVPEATTGCSSGDLVITQVSGPLLGTELLANNTNDTIGYEFSDNCNNSTSCSFSVTLQAFQPTIDFSFCPVDIIIEATSLNGAIADWSIPTITTNCSGGGNVIQTTGPANGSLFPIGTTEVRYQGSANTCNITKNCIFTVTVIEPNTGTCNVTVNSSNNSVVITGMTSDSNTKLFNSDIVPVWKCNPWTGSPCSNSEIISGLNVGETYFLSVVSDVCQEWIPVVIEDSNFRYIQNQNRRIVVNNVFPLPAEDYIIIDLSSKETIELEAKAYDARGTLVDWKTVNLIDGQNLVKWDISRLPSGFYQILLDVENHHEPIRFLKQRL